MTYTQQGDRVTIEMTRGLFRLVLKAILTTAGIARRGGHERDYWAWMRLANELNNGNPDYTPCEIPEEYRHADPA